ncbi:MAG: von Willebrand factor type A domain-containing protein [Alphaproteobacteria bacterium]
MGKVVRAAGMLVMSAGAAALIGCEGQRLPGQTAGSTTMVQTEAVVLGIEPLAPLVAPSETYAEFAAGGFTATADQPHSTFAADVDTAAYSRIRRFLAEGTLPPADLVRIEEMVNYFAYDYPVPADRYHPLAISTEFAPSPWNDRTSILRVGIQGFHEETVLRPPLNLVFLVDVSGSMEPSDRLPLMQRGLVELAAMLRPIDRVALVTYANGVEVVLEPTSGDRQGVIRDAVTGLRAGGSTNGAGGLEAAYDLAAANYDPKAVNRVILVTDGDFNVGASRPDQIGDLVAARRDLGIYMTVLGVGTGNLNDGIMQAIAQRGDGIAAYVDSEDEMRRALHASTAHALFPIADDVKIQVSFNPALVAEYRLLGYETRAITREQFYDDAADGGDVSAGHSVTAIYEIVPGLSIASAEPRIQPASYLPPTEGWRADGLAQVEVRYQRPFSDTVERITAQVGESAHMARIEQADSDTRFAAAVAGFGLLLRDDPAMLRGFDYAAVERLADSARGTDPLGTRAEFVDLVRTAARLAR